MTKPGTKAKKAKSENEVPLPKGSLSPKPNIMYIEVNSYTENTTLPHSNLHTMNVFSSSLPLTRNALKPPHNWIVSIDGQHSKVRQKSKAMRYAFLPKRTGWQRTSRQSPYPRHEMPIQDCRNRSITCPLKSMWTPQTAACCTQEHKKPPHARQRKPMRKAAKCLDCPKGRAWKT